MVCKKLLVGVALLTTFTLQGCATTNTQSVPDSHPESAPAGNANEALLQAVGNHSGLIALYRQRLAQSTDSAEQDEQRLKLAETYLKAGDTESALFYCQPVIEGTGTLKKACLLVRSRALLAAGDHQQALIATESALTLDPQNPVTLNQLGLVYADARRYEEARTRFNQARLLMLDDVTVRNNLAMVDLLEQHWQQAADKLLPLFHSGQADDKVTANLLLALARSERMQEFIAVCGRARQTCQRYYSTLSQTTLSQNGRI